MTETTTINDSKEKHMKTTSLLILTAILFYGLNSQATFLPTERIPKLKKQNITEINIRDIGNDTLHVVAVTKNTNACKVPDYKVKTKNTVDGIVTYELFGFNEESRLCPTVMNPTYNDVIVDIIPKTKISDVSALKVNGKVVIF